MRTRGIPRTPSSVVAARASRHLYASVGDDGLDEIMSGESRSVPGPSGRATAWRVAAVFAAATLARGLGEFRYDALYYWLAAQRVVGSIGSAPEGYWGVRGVLTAFVYVPAAAASAVIGADVAGFAVLVQNTVVLAWFAAFLLPRFIGRGQPVSARVRWLGALLTWLVAAGFARYPLVDIYPAIACVAIVVLLRSDRRVALVLAGLVAGVSVNLRPAYMVTVVLLIVAVLVWRRWIGLLMPAGVAVALLPQALFNVAKHGLWSLWPPASGALMAMQASLAAYVVRYDTLFGAAQPQQFYCSPAMAERLSAPLPTTMGGLASTFLSNMPTSISFSLEKIGAALHWPLSTPYTTPMVGLDALFALFITAVTVAGVAAFVRSAVRARSTWSSSRWFDWAAVVGIAVGTILTLVSAATESRFALPLVLIGVLGIAPAADVRPREALTRERWWIVGVLVVTIAVVVVGYAGLSHPTPPGVFDQATCASL